MDTTHTLRMAVLGLVALSISACGSRHFGQPDTPAPPPLRTAYTIERDLVYTPPDWPQRLLADVYRPEGAGPHPAVLLIHGGAWKRGDRAQVERLAERIAARGFVVVNITYRLVPAHIYPAQLHDVQQALRWMRDEGARHGIDPARIATFGYSAGGHLAALAGHVANDAELGDPRTRVQAIVAGGTPADLTLYPGGRLVPAFLGGTRDRIPERFREASPAFHVDAEDPPVFIYHATLDQLVPLEQAERYKSALDAAGVVNELFLIRGHGHISGFFADGAAVEAALRFLDRHLR
ncbi:alpha/beta hydrolase [Sinimarinibacterium thermocellulolyticum]|uniref:Alpha/beta hydrolase n=1 Tax=Sinimarinibacterium thermocellulolyticum TaxID=3170016 RepID=A0ABV2AC02_9GAMM